MEEHEKQYFMQQAEIMWSVDELSPILNMLQNPKKTEEVFYNLAETVYQPGKKVRFSVM